MMTESKQLPITVIGRDARGGIADGPYRVSGTGATLPAGIEADTNYRLVAGPPAIVDVREMFRTDGQFRESILRLAAQCGASASEVLEVLDQTRGSSAPGEDMASALNAIRAERSKARPAQRATYRPGERQSGHRERPPVPAWARKRGGR